MKSEGDNGSPFLSLLEDLKSLLVCRLIMSETILFKYTFSRVHRFLVPGQVGPQPQCHKSFPCQVKI